MANSRAWSSHLIPTWAALILGVAFALVAPSVIRTTGMGAATYVYDAPAVPRVDVDEFVAVDATTALLSGAQEGSASPTAQIRGTSTTPDRDFIATNTGSRGLGNLGGIMEETGTNAAGGRIFTSTGAINQNDFAGIV